MNFSSEIAKDIFFFAIFVCNIKKATSNFLYTVDVQKKIHDIAYCSSHIQKKTNKQTNTNNKKNRTLLRKTESMVGQISPWNYVMVDNINTIASCFGDRMVSFE